MNYNKNDLNLTISGTDKILTNELQNEFYNVKTGRQVKVVRNCRSFGIWSKRKFIPLSKIQVEKEIKNDYSEDLINLLNQLNKMSL